MRSEDRTHDVIPHVGIGPLRLGMTADEVRVATFGTTVASTARGREEMIFALGLSVDYSTEGIVNFVQAFDARGVRTPFAGRDVFATAADDMVAAVVRHAGLDPEDFPEGDDECSFPTLGLVLWREFAGEVPGEPGWAFSTISIHSPGYYD
jgi:hypothetical protein